MKYCLGMRPRDCQSSVVFSAFTWKQRDALNKELSLTIAICKMNIKPTSERCSWLGWLWTRSGRYIFIACHVCKCILALGSNTYILALCPGWISANMEEDFSSGYFSVAVVWRWGLLHPERWALLCHVCIGNLLPETEFHSREMCQYHCLDVFFCCLENKISLV